MTTAALNKIQPNGICRSCKAPIIWARMPSGKMMPIDPLVDPKGFVTVDRVADDGTVLLGAMASKLPRVTERFNSHFASCPDAASHRKRHGVA